MAAVSYKCPNCGGELRFDPVSQKYKCEYCLSYFDDVPEEEAKRQEEYTGAGEGTDSGSDRGAEMGRESGDAAETGGGDGAAGGEAVVYTCPSCGAEIVTDATTAATFCYYCHNPVVLEGRLSGEYLPDRVIPFKLDKKKATEAFLSFVKKKKFVPGAFFNERQIEKLTGVYYPYWICDTKGNGELQGTATRVRVWQAGDMEYTETKTYLVKRAGAMELKELPKNALKKADRQLCEGVWPYDLGSSVPFEMGYLSGFQAEKRDLDRADLEEEVQADVQEYGKRLMRESVNSYDTFHVEKTQIQTEDQKWNYMLLPVWVLTYRDKAGKQYYYAMNGQNGEFGGVLPIDRGKLAALFFGVAIPVLIACLLGGYFL
ncbi:MAG: TFIIB-type zinc ribbon-containing protein [Candidatus Limivivens sp.]|nr:TFIIB-type zinc ribbon-containing protein [Candidatus Limivivens sp.]